MTTIALLDNWSPPEAAGDPVAVLATTFVLDHEHFEKDCLSRFLALSSVADGERHRDDLLADIEMQEALRTTPVSVLVDRSSDTSRGSLQWDLLPCHVPNALLHAKVSILLWERATRVIIGSANLTRAGYREQLELQMAVELGEDCILPRNVLDNLVDELTRYLALIPGAAGTAAIRRAQHTLDLFRDRIRKSSRQGSDTAKVAFAPTNTQSSALDTWKEAWSGGLPTRATQLSPFWDDSDSVKRVAGLLTGRPKSRRRHTVVTGRNRDGEVEIATEILDLPDVTVWDVQDTDEEYRTLHAKCLLLESAEWVAALIGSSNHTRSGLGFAPASRTHREINVWLGAPRSSKEGRALRSLITCRERITPDDLVTEPVDEDETADETPALPLGFQSCILIRRVDWMVCMAFDPEQLPGSWTVRLPGDRTLVTADSWNAQGAPMTVDVALPEGDLCTGLDVEWEDQHAIWPVLAEDKAALPLGATLSSVSSQGILEALARGERYPLGDSDREEHVSQADDDLIDPLRQYDDTGTILRRGRQLSHALDRLAARLARPSYTLDGLNARLTGFFGPQHIADKLVDEVKSCDTDVDTSQMRIWALFCIAELALTLDRVDWGLTFAELDRDTAQAAVDACLTSLQTAVSEIEDQTTTVGAYAHRAIKKALQCHRL